MNITVFPSKLNGSIAAPPSKSVAHRAIIGALLSKGMCTIENIALSDDISATIDAVRTLGKKVHAKDGKLIVSGEISADNIVINCRESGSTLRFFLPILAALGIGATFTGSGRLPARPINIIMDLMGEKGIKFTQNEGLPVSISGKLTCGKFFISGGVSSQYITALLFALPILEGESEIILTSKLESEPYIDITIDVLEKFGIEVKKIKNGYYIKGNQSYKTSDYFIEGDYSNGAFFMCSAAIGGSVEVCGLSKHSFQGDKAVVDILKDFGADISENNGSIVVKNDCLKALEIDASNIPDIVPILAVVATFANGKTTIYNAGRLRIKESDRLMAITEGLKKMGADIYESKDTLVINGAKTLKGATVVNAYNDHRIAMSLSVAAANAQNPVDIIGFECIRKSYPNFYEDFKSLGGRVHEFDMGQ